MFTQNYINVMRGLFNEEGANLVYQDGTSSTPSYVQGVDAVKVGKLISSPRCENPNSGLYGLYFGSGSTPATKNDYALEAPITSGLAFTYGKSVTGKTKEGQYATWVSHVVKNMTSNAINIYEIGVFGNALVESSSYKRVLLERTVLKEPIVIPAGDEKIITYKLTLNQALNVE